MTAAHRLHRLFTARDVAVVGASERGMRSRNAIEAMSYRGVRLHLVSRRGEPVLGRPTVRSLTELADRGVSADAALLFTNPSAAVDITAEAAAVGVGGVVVNAGGFAEAGADGVKLQQRLITAAQQMPVLGPNCNGLISPSRGLHLAGSPPDVPIPVGQLAFVTHSGATMLPMGVAGTQRLIGYSYLVSTGNEAAVDMAEVIDYLATDDATSAICLLIETVRRPQSFFGAVDRAIQSGKPVLALKNGRSQRGQAIAKSHTGAVAGQAWIYEAALRQHGVVIANDLVDLADRSVLFDQVPSTRWTTMNGLAITSGSGGWVTMASDVCGEEGVPLPALDHLKAQIADAVPGVSVVNPLDLTGAAMTDPTVMARTLNTFVASPDVDTVLMLSSLSDGATQARQAFIGPALDLAPVPDTLLVVGSIEDGPIGKDLQPYREHGIAVTRGLRATVRALQSMSEFVSFVPPVPPTRRHRQIGPPSTVTNRSGERLVSFSAAMTLLSKFGIPVAPYLVLDEFDDLSQVGVPFDPPYVVKLADVAHRTDVGALRVGVDAQRLAVTVDELRTLADRLGSPRAVAIQPKYEVYGELLFGVDASNELGAFVVCGLGGVLVEVLQTVSGRLAPLEGATARRMLDDINVSGVLDGPRGSTPWPLDEVAEILTAVGDLATSAGAWLGSFDINPLALTSNGVVALDALMIPRGDITPGDHSTRRTDLICSSSTAHEARTAR